MPGAKPRPACEARNNFGRVGCTRLFIFPNEYIFFGNKFYCMAYMTWYSHTPKVIAGSLACVALGLGLGLGLHTLHIYVFIAYSYIYVIF